MTFDAAKFTAGRVFFRAHFCGAQVSFYLTLSDNSPVSFNDAEFTASTVDLAHATGKRPAGLSKAAQHSKPGTVLLPEDR
ncbi:hypothetical protein [Nocardiopsis lucentensis]|uniref:hypothetical protein n=1 Tax=Nocardiopsis lucentensis TaxID=53441 RepID=UPI00034C2F3F|nr:hypothetical protein [Nocardiopsis lucentensis]